MLPPAYAHMESLQLTSFGHLPGCLCQFVPNSLEPKPECPYMRTANRRCGKQLSKQGCARMQGVDAVGFCSEHYKMMCRTNGWDQYLSRCANELCDRLEIDLDLRKRITSENILTILGLPAKIKYGKRTVTTHHIRGKVQRGISSRDHRPFELVIDLASSSDAVDEGLEDDDEPLKIEDGSESSSDSFYSTSSDDERLCSDDEEVIGLYS
jgi:hypothetical protein